MKHILPRGHEGPPLPKGPPLSKYRERKLPKETGPSRRGLEYQKPPKTRRQQRISKVCRARAAQGMQAGGQAQCQGMRGQPSPSPADSKSQRGDVDEQVLSQVLHQSQKLKGRAPCALESHGLPETLGTWSYGQRRLRGEKPSKEHYRCTLSG